MCENKDQKNSEYGHFSRSEVFYKKMFLVVDKLVR